LCHSTSFFRSSITDFADDNFTFYPDHARAVCEEIIARKLSVSWALINGIRADRVDEPLLRLMKKAGCYYTAFGLESGSQATLTQYKKSLDVKKVYDTVRIANKLGYITQGFFLIAPPFETEQDLAATLGLIRALPLDRIAIGVPIPYPGTELYATVQKTAPDKLKDIDYNYYDGGDYAGSRLNLSAVPDEVLFGYQRRPGAGSIWTRAAWRGLCATIPIRDIVRTIYLGMQCAPRRDSLLKDR